MVGKYYENELEFKPIFNYHIRKNVENIFHKKVCCCAPSNVILDLRNNLESLSGESTNCYQYKVISSEGPVVCLFVFIDNQIPENLLRPGIYYVDYLENLFEKTYWRMNDLFPRPIVSPQTII